MTGFVILGEGFPARRVVELVAAAPGARVLGVVSSTPPQAAADLAVLEPRVLKSESGTAWMRALGADWLLNINSTVMLSQATLELVRGRALNAHPGLLPEYAGLHVHQWAIRNGEKEFGATVHLMAAEVDAGPVVAQRRFDVRPDDTGLSLFRRCMAACVELLGEVATGVARRDRLTPQPQDLSRRHVYRHRDALDSVIDWQMPAHAIVDFVRAGNYEPLQSPTYTASMTSPRAVVAEVLRARVESATDACPGTLVGVSEDGPLIACGDGKAVRLTRARSGRKVLGFAEWRAFFEI